MYAAPNNKSATITATNSTSKSSTKLVQYKRDIRQTAEDAITVLTPPPYNYTFNRHTDTTVLRDMTTIAPTANGRSNSTTTTAATAASSEHPLQYAWTYWFMHRAPGQKIDHYESSMVKIATFATVESFWAVYSHLKRPDQVPTITDYQMFRAGVRPVWEDPANIDGGKWMIRLKKGLASRLWEKLTMAVVGDLFEADQVCGIVLSVRNSEDIISLWNKTAADTKTNALIHDVMKRAMGLPADTVMEYKAHNDSLRDTSTFRGTDVNK
ncbi:hypothetical protein FBU31_006753 [Coemansia sp. 'formosensis']|nr:hypothetical protein FBU31_006753 [Coemansia sp. 'formosensis']